MPTILCIFKINDSGMSFRKTVGVHPFCKQTHCDQFSFLSLVRTFTHLEYPLPHLRTRSHRLILSVVFTFFVCHSFLTLFYLITYLKWPIRFFFCSDTHKFQSGISYNPRLPTAKCIFVSGDFLNNRWRKLTTQKQRGVIPMKHYDEFYECFEFEFKNCLMNNLKHKKSPMYVIHRTSLHIFFIAVKKQSRPKILFEKNWKRFGWLWFTKII